MLIGVVAPYKDAGWRLGIVNPYKMIYIYDEEGRKVMEFPVSMEVLRLLKEDFNIIILNEEELFPPSIRKVFYLEEEARKLALPEILREMFNLSPKEYPVIEKWKPLLDIVKWEETTIPEDILKKNKKE